MQIAGPRTLAEAVTDVRYACNYGELNERFWRRLDTLLNLIGAAGGSTAIAGVLTQNATLNMAAGIVLALVSSLQLVLRPSDKVMAFCATRREFLALESKAWTMPLSDLDAARKKIEADAPIGLQGLAYPAYNLAVRQIGHPDAARRLTLHQRLLAALA